MRKIRHNRICLVGLVAIILLMIAPTSFVYAEASSNCSKMALPIETTISAQNQVTHPSMVSFEKEWNGYKYWFSFTPYPFGNGTFENPCVVGSNDMKDFEVPKGAHNPIASLDETNCDELKDANLLYREDTNELECWYLGRINGSIGSGEDLVLFRKTTADGVNWTKYEIMYVCTDKNIVSPTIIFENNKYKCWGFYSTNTERELLYMESNDGVNWSDFEECEIPDLEENNAWHGAVSHINDVYALVFVGNQGDGKDNVFYCESIDGKTYNQPIPIVTNNVGWKFLYRPFLAYVDNTYYLYYGTTSFDNYWGISLSCGDDITNLKPIEMENTDVSFKNNLYASTPKREISCAIKNINNGFSVIVVAITAFVTSIVFLLTNLSKRRKLTVAVTVFSACIMSVLISYYFARSFNQFFIFSVITNGLLIEAITIPVSILLTYKNRK